MTAAEPSESTAAPRLSFPLQDGERVILLSRRHWIYLWPTILGEFLIAIVPVVLLALLLDAVDLMKGVGSQVFIALAVLYIGYWVVRLAITWYRYHNDVWVITNQRLIDSHRRHPFDMSISTADLVNVQDMSVQRSGILRTMLDYGDVVCQTASIDQDFMIGGVADPRGVQALVDRERDRERGRLRGPSA